MTPAARTLLIALSFANTEQAMGADAPEAPVRLNASEFESARAGAPFRMFSAWVEAMNSGDPARLRGFLERHYPDVKPNAFERLRYNSNGLELRALEAATATGVAGLVQERDSDNFLRFKLVLKAGAPDRIESLEILYIPRPADFPPPRLTEVEIFAALDAKLAKDAADDRFSGAVLVTHHGKVVYRAAHGLADREKKRPNSIDTRFDIGSMSKMFTATAIMQLVEAGKIHLADPVGKYLPDYPNQDIATKVTIEHLLTHQGGTGNIFGPEYDAHRLDLRTHADYMKLWGARGPEFEPGSRFEYSNYGMVLLGMVIEKVAGKSYFEYVEKHVFKPAKMTRTASEPIDEPWPNTAIGYMRTPEGGRKPNFEILSYRGTSAGGGRSTVGDLARFAEALMGNKLLSPATTQQLITGKVPTPNGSRYAFGFVDERAQHGNIGHDGGAPGVSAVLKIFPESGYVVAVLSNFDPPFAGRIGSHIAVRLENRRDAVTSSRP